MCNIYSPETAIYLWTLEFRTPARGVTAGHTAGLPAVGALSFTYHSWWRKSEITACRNRHPFPHLGLPAKKQRNFITAMQLTWLVQLCRENLYHPHHLPSPTIFCLSKFNLAVG